MRLVLCQPEIPPNTGNVARLCAATGTALHLVKPLGFSLSDRHLKRAGLDYWASVRLTIWPDWRSFETGREPGRLVLTSARRGEPLHAFPFLHGDYIVLGPETRGLPEEVYALERPVVTIPITSAVRSLNMSTSAGILLYEALRQTGGLDGLAR